MNNSSSSPNVAFKVVQTIALFMVLMGCIMIGSIVFLQSLHFLTNTSPSSQDGLLAMLKQTSDSQLYLLISQLLTALTTFIVIPGVYILFFQADLKSQLSLTKSRNQYSNIVWVILITIASFPVIGFLADFNKSLHLPQSMASTEQWMLKSEQDAKVLTEMMVYFNGSWTVPLVILVIAVLPGVGEELLFRGVLQNRLKTIFGAPHFAIICSGFIFSFIHFQFYGFIPRMFLGVLFGYIYYWSGNLLLPMMMHFINNLATTLVVNWQKDSGSQSPLDSAEHMPLGLVITSVVVLTFLIWKFREDNQYYRSTSNSI